MSRWFKRSPAWVISILGHATFLFIASLIGFLVCQPEIEARLIARKPPQKVPYDPAAKPEMFKHPEIKLPPVPHPVVVLEEERVNTDIPKGTSPDNPTNKDLNADSLIDAYGVSGPPCGAYGDRTGKPGLGNNGGSEKTEIAVRGALEWLAKHQHPDGRWDIDGFGERCRGSRCEGIGESPYDVGVTSLALLAFLGHGNTHRVGDFKDNVRSALAWLKTQQKSGGPLDGAIGVEAEPGETIYNHALATMALCETLAVTQDPMLRKPCQRAVGFCLQAQNQSGDPARARAWKYGLRSGLNDTSVTGWMVFALKAARNARLDVPEIGFAGARNWLEQITDDQGIAGYASRGGGSSYKPAQKGKYAAVPCMTAAGAVCRIFMGEKRTSKAVQQGCRALMAALPAWKNGAKSTVNLYYWYYATYACFEAFEPDSSPWKKWNEAMQTALLPTQRRDGCEHGSWDPLCEWGGAGGRVYATAMGALTLEVYYRYARPEDTPEVASSADARGAAR